MGYNADFNKKFLMQFGSEVDALVKQAYVQGVLDMAQDTLDTLGDYATAVAGIQGLVYTREQAYDAAKGSLEAYYTQVLKAVQ